MKTIVLMRHSYASSENSAFADHERPLTQRGRDLAETTARLVLDQVQPDRILCSSAARAAETANIFSTQFKSGPVPESIDSLYLSPPGRYPAVAAEQLTETDESVLFVGHNPGIASLICSWADESLAIMPATVAIFRLIMDDWRVLTSASKPVPELTGLISNGARLR